MNTRKLLTIPVFMLLLSCSGSAVKSPDNRIGAVFSDKEITITYGNAAVQAIELNAGKFLGIRQLPDVHEEYDMLTGKCSHCENDAKACIVHYRNTDIEFRAFNDGIAFRDLRPASGTLFSWVVPDGRRRWISKRKTDYEESFPLDSIVRTGEWNYPALLQYAGDVFGLITESGMERGHSASHLSSVEVCANYYVVPESGADGSVPGPWRVLILGSLADVVESTLVTDLAAPCRVEDTSWIHPGVSSWIYWAHNHGSNNLDIINSYTDLAASMGWPYNLVDAEWDEMIGGHNIKEAVDYAAAKGVKTNIWYNSGTGWTSDGAPGPIWRMLDPDIREDEMSLIESWGVTGMKIDFFDGDRREMMDYYIDILEDAARHHLMVDFHGCTLPRGWQRTYPHLMTMEGVYGAEWYNNKPRMTRLAASHNATLPFTRNVVGSMDYTPGTFTDTQHPHITTDAHEMALTVLFESGLQHLPDRPSTYLSMPEAQKRFFRELPASWDETRLLGGYPGEYVVMARRHGDCWYIAGINGTDEPKTIDVDLKGISIAGATVFTDGPVGRADMQVDSIGGIPYTLSLLPRGGFTAVCESAE